MIKNQITQCREARGLLKSQLAYYTGVSRSCITKLEQGSLVPSLDLALRLARCLKKSVEEIFQLVDGQKNTFPDGPPSTLGELTNTDGKKKRKVNRK